MSHFLHLHHSQLLKDAVTAVVDRKRGSDRKTAETGKEEVIVPELILLGQSK